MSVKATNLVIAHGGVEVISESSFALPAGKVTAVIGPNGSGKSTLLDSIAGLVTPRSGALEVVAAPGRIAYVLQNPRVNESLPITVKEVVAMGRYSSTGWLGRLG
ncbi:MAG: ATP-binding cassette domain-containing protein, partial [Acidimicrobiia bacterium]